MFPNSHASIISCFQYISSDRFEMLIDKEMRYEKECVENDEDFLIFEVEADIATFIKS